MSILALPDDVRARIKSSIEITSLNNVVEELFKNALDAGAGNVTIEVDFGKGFCSVKDDGVGIPSTEFFIMGRLAQLYCESGQSSMSLPKPSSELENVTHSAVYSVKSRLLVSRQLISAYTACLFELTIQVLQSRIPDPTDAMADLSPVFLTCPCSSSPRITSPRTNPPR